MEDTSNFKNVSLTKYNSKEKLVRYQLILRMAGKWVKSQKESRQKKLIELNIQNEITRLEKLMRGRFSFNVRSESKSLTRILENIKSTLESLKQIKNLPPDGALILNETLGLGETTIAHTSKVQVDAKSFIGANKPKLETVLKDLEKSSVPIEAVKKNMNEISINAATLKAEADKLNTNETIEKIGALNAQSINLENNYKAQANALEIAIQDAQVRLAEAEERRWYFLALGIFGVAGVIAAVVVITNINNEIDDLYGQLNVFNQNLNTARNLSASISALNTLFDELFGEVIFLKNDIDFIIGQINNIIQNLDQTELDIEGLKLFVITTMESMNQLDEYVS